MPSSYWLYSFKSRSQSLGMNCQIFRSGWPNLVWVGGGHIGGAGGTLEGHNAHASHKEANMPLKERKALDPIWKI